MTTAITTTSTVSRTQVFDAYVCYPSGSKVGHCVLLFTANHSHYIHHVGWDTSRKETSDDIRYLVEKWENNNIIRKDKSTHVGKYSGIVHVPIADLTSLAIEMNLHPPKARKYCAVNSCQDFVQSACERLQLAVPMITKDQAAVVTALAGTAVASQLWRKKWGKKEFGWLLLLVAMVLVIGWIYFFNIQRN
jgi:hypothetical protein